MGFVVWACGPGTVPGQFLCRVGKFCPLGFSALFDLSFSACVLGAFEACRASVLQFFFLRDIMDLHFMRAFVLTAFEAPSVLVV